MPASGAELKSRRPSSAHTWVTKVNSSRSVLAGAIATGAGPATRSLALFDPARLERDTYTGEDLQPGGTLHSLVWGRDTSAKTADDFLRKVGADLLVSGHIASETGFSVPNDRQVIVDSAESPSGYILFPADRPLTHDELVGCIRTF